LAGDDAVARPSFSAIALLAVLGTSCAPRTERFVPQPGDLLFQDLDSGPLCEAIERVTEGYGGAEFSHVGIVARSPDGSPLVIEALPRGVVRTPLAEFLDRSHDSQCKPKVVVGRLRPRYRALVPRALREAERLVGKPYDRAFAIGNDRYYCSELIYEIFRRANGGQPLLRLAPMTFKDPATGRTLSAWADYFRKLHIPVPEGRPGISPAALSRSPKLEIVHAYGKPAR